jgi:hypothetical protein
VEHCQLEVLAIVGFDAQIKYVSFLQDIILLMAYVFYRKLGSCNQFIRRGA